MSLCQEALGHALHDVLLSLKLSETTPVPAPHPFWKHFEWLLLLVLPVAYLLLGLLFGLAIFKFTVAYWLRLRAARRGESLTAPAAALPVLLHSIKPTSRVF
jgi:hypothetical protein